jgi:hypothetical protein
VIDRDVPGDRQQPCGKAGHVAAVAMARPPGFLERARRQVLGVGRRPEAIAKKVVNAGQLLDVDGLPVRFGCGHPPHEPARQNLVECHL